MVVGVRLRPSLRHKDELTSVAGLNVVTGVRFKLNNIYLGSVERLTEFGRELCNALSYIWTHILILTVN